MPTAEAASAFISTFLAGFAGVAEPDRVAFVSSVLDWRELAPVAVGPRWEELSDGQREAALTALTGHVAALIADLPLTSASLAIQAGRGLRMGNVGVEGVSFLGRLRPRLTAIAEAQGIDAVIRELSQTVG